MPTDTDTNSKPVQDSKGLYQKWKSQIDDALKREKKYRQTGQKIVNLYEAKAPEDVPFSILYSNTEVLVPALYNATPIPIVQRRFKDEDPLGKVAAETSVRMLKYLIDTESESYDSFDDLMQSAVLEGALTNRGLTRFKFVADTALPECVYGEAVRWDKFFHGYARTWKKVPWVGFEWDMSQEEIKKNFPDKPIDFSKGSSSAEDEDNKSESREELTGVKVYKVYEIWDKSDRMVKFFSPCYSDGPLRVVEDPLGLSGFFPCPRPLNFMRKVSTLVPTPLYEHYRQQAQELNELTRRLKAVIRAVKVRGAYNAAVEGIEKILDAADNELVPVENVQSMPDGTGMDKLLWLMPIQELVATAQSLYQQREQVKQVIYEITGISDILRGASVASETATAQQIKNQWGSLRLKKMQKEVQRYCRESLAIILEIAAGKFEAETIRQMTGLNYLTDAQKAQMQEQIQMVAQQAQAQAQMAGQPAQPPQVPPEIQEQLQQPSWDQIIAILRNQVALHYRTDIETNSTIDAEAAQDKQDISELLNALSQFLNGLAPLVQQGSLSVDVAKSMLLVVARRYTFGSQLEDAIMQMKAPQPQADPAAQEKAAQAQAEAKAAAQKAQMDMQLAQMEFENKKQLMVLQLQIDQAELELKKQELAIQARSLELKAQAEAQKHAQRMQQMAVAAAQKPKEPANALV